MTVWYTVWLPSMTLLATVAAHPTLASLVGLGGLGCLGIGVVITAWRTGPAVDWSLLSRMVVSLLMLSVLTVVFVTALWRLIEVFAWFWLSVVGIGDDVGTVIDTIVSAYPAFTIPRHSAPTHEAFIATVIVFGGFVVVALWNLRGNTPLTRADATLVSATEYPPCTR